MAGKKPSPPRRMMGTAGVAAHKREPFGYREHKANREKFRKIEAVLGIKLNKSSRQEIMRLLSECLSFEALWLNARSRKKMHDELRCLQRDIRREEEKSFDAMASLKPETLHRLNLCGLGDHTNANELPSIIKSALNEVPKDEGGRPVNEHHRFLMEQFAKLFEKKMGKRPTLSYSYHEEQYEYEGKFLDCVSILFEMSSVKPPTKKATAQLYKRLFYKNN